MKTQVSDKKPHVWITFIGFILFLIGIYGSVRTSVNFLAFSRYPSQGVFNMMGVPMYGPSEQDCINTMYSPPYPLDSGKISEEDRQMMKEQEKKQMDSCLNSVMQAREQAKVNDVSQSLLLLLLGGGTLVVRKYFSS